MHNIPGSLFICLPLKFEVSENVWCAPTGLCLHCIGLYEYIMRNILKILFLYFYFLFLFLICFWYKPSHLILIICLMFLYPFIPHFFFGFYKSTKNIFKYNYFTVIIMIAIIIIIIKIFEIVSDLIILHYNERSEQKKNLIILGTSA